MTSRLDAPLFLLGAGGHGRSCLDVLDSLGWCPAGIVERPSLGDTEVFGIPVVGCDQDLVRLLPGAYFLVGVGQIKTPEPRIRLFRAALDAGGRPVTAVSPLARVSPYARVGRGTVVMHHALVNAGAVVGENCIINSAALIEHDAAVADHCHVSTSAVVNGEAVVGEGCFVGSGAVVREGIRLGERAVIGMGVAVRRHVPPQTFFTGERP